MTSGGNHMIRIAGLILGLFLAGAAQPAPETVRLGQGMVQGVAADGVVSFKGVAYAAPPVGNLRWRGPQPAPRWSGVRRAEAFGPPCIQMLERTDLPAQSEDCLTLNVYAPAGADLTRVPVMVWIHGGGFVGGWSGHYDGSHLARRGVIVVTLNYRLGRLGFFGHPAILRAGEGANFGLLDQIAALKWVHDNIAAFGGDPSNVTAFGESAGAISVQWLMIAPQARGLFAKAISESGFARTPGKTLDQARTAALAFAEANGVAADTPGTADALRKLPVEAVAKPVSGLTDPNAPFPILDQVVASESLPAAFAAGRQAPVPFLLGGNSDEASLFEGVVEHADAFLNRLGPTAGPATQLYGGGDKTKAVAGMLTIATVIEPNRFLAREQARIGQPVWLYYFDYVPQALRADLRGSGHGEEIAYVFGTLPTAPHERPFWDRRPGPRTLPAADETDRAISEAMQAYWVSFAKTGSPDSAGGPSWPHAGADGNIVLEFGAGGVQVRKPFEPMKLDIITAQAEKNGGALIPF